MLELDGRQVQLSQLILTVFC